jgi:type II secretory pathway pseudopilin PulG
MANVRHNVGLTLIEMLVVVGIIVLLAALAIVMALRIENQSKERAVANIFALLRSALQEYHEETSTFPSQPERNYSNAAAHIRLMREQLDSVPASRRVLRQVNGAFVRVDTDAPGVSRICDPWGTALDYFYAPDGQFPELTSAGPDERFGTADDINSKDM